jgi:hypothetical protein
MVKNTSNVKDPLRTHGIILIIILTLEYILGMITNLFVIFPENKNVEQMWAFAKLQLPIILHVLVGYSLLIAALVLLIRAIRMKNKRWIIASVISNISILVAIITGVLSVPSQVGTYSFIMAISFIIALLSIGWALYMTNY